MTIHEKHKKQAINAISILSFENMPHDEFMDEVELICYKYFPCCTIGMIDTFQTFARTLKLNAYHKTVFEKQVMRYSKGDRSNSVFSKSTLPKKLKVKAKKSS